jgi:hypothetical protein
MIDNDIDDHHDDVDDHHDDVDDVDDVDDADNVDFDEWIFLVVDDI